MCHAMRGGMKFFCFVEYAVCDLILLSLSLSLSLSLAGGGLLVWRPWPPLTLSFLCVVLPRRQFKCSATLKKTNRTSVDSGSGSSSVTPSVSVWSERNVSCQRNCLFHSETQQQRWHHICFDPSNRMQRAHHFNRALFALSLTRRTQQMTKTSSHHPG